jgi:hypothetical protein
MVQGRSKQGSCNTVFLGELTMTKKIITVLFFFITGVIGVFPQYQRNQYQYVFQNNSDYPVTVFFSSGWSGSPQKLGVVNPGAEQVYPSLMNPLYDGQGWSFRYEYDSNRVAYTEKNEYWPTPINGNLHITVNVTFSNKPGSQSAAPAPSGTILREGMYTRNGTMATMYLRGSKEVILYENGTKEVGRGTYTIDGNRLTLSFSDAWDSAASMKGSTLSYNITSVTSFTGKGDSWNLTENKSAAPVPDFMTRPILPGNR